MTDYIQDVKYQRGQFLKAVYQLGRESESPLREAIKDDICARLGLDPQKNPEDDNKYDTLAQDLIDDGDITSMTDELTIVQITTAGRRKVENNEF